LILESIINEAIDLSEDLTKMIDWVNTKYHIGEVVREGDVVKIVSKSCMPETMEYEDTSNLGIARLVRNNVDMRDDLLN
jgi:hypothetical protein